MTEPILNGPDATANSGTGEKLQTIAEWYRWAMSDEAVALAEKQQAEKKALSATKADAQRDNHVFMIFADGYDPRFADATKLSDLRFTHKDLVEIYATAGGFGENAKYPWFDRFEYHVKLGTFGEVEIPSRKEINRQLSQQGDEERQQRIEAYADHFQIMEEGRLLAAERKAKAKREASGLVLPDTTPSVLDFLDEGDDELEFVIPGRLPVGARYLQTGGEGSGKSTFFRWQAVCIALGIDPFTLEQIEPRRVMIVDAENPKPLLRKRWNEVFSLLEQLGYDRRDVRDRLFIESRPESIDFVDSVEGKRLDSLVRAHEPEVLAIGPIYRLCSLPENEEPFFDAITGVIDEVRIAHNLTVMMEAHSPHSQPGTPVIKRPVGSRSWMRWTEIGLWLGPVQNGGFQRLDHWRASRFGDDIRWPALLQREEGTTGRWIAATRPEPEELGPAQRRFALFQANPPAQHLDKKLRETGEWYSTSEVVAMIPTPRGMTPDAHKKAVTRLLDELIEVEAVESKTAVEIGQRGNKRFYRALSTGQAAPVLDITTESINPNLEGE